MLAKKGRPARREFLKSTSTALLGLACTPSMAIARVVSSFDLVIRNGMVLDGTGGPPLRLDIGIVGDVVKALDRISPERAKQILDAQGQVVAPGFIDIHTHSDSSILRYPTADSRVLQGITTEVTGNCGGSAAPISQEEAKQRKSEDRTASDKEKTWTDVTSYLEVLDKIEISLNHALLLGHGTLRSSIAGLEDRELTPSELTKLESMITEGLDQGAFGLSTGLEYIPGRFTPTDELIRTARVVARFGGFYASHIRNEEAQLLEAVAEALEVGKESGVRVQISHLKAAGRRNWAKQAAALYLIESARQRGIDVLADAYPYTAYSTGLTIFVSSWALAGGWIKLKTRLDNSKDRNRILKEIDERVKEDPGDYSLAMISSVKTSKNQSVVGKNLVEIAKDWQVEPVEAILKLLVEEEGNVGFIGHGMSSDNVDMVLGHPLVMVGSDGRSMAPEGQALKSNPHPRSYGTCARVLGYYVREKNLLTLTEAVRKMTSMPADQIGLKDRGLIARGKKADLVIFEPEKVIDRATFDSPHQFPDGIKHVLVNGQIVVENSRHTGRKPGRALRRG